MTSCAVIACDHGYGHTRRCIMLSNALAAEGWAVTLLASGPAASRFPVAGGVAVEDFRTSITVDGLRRGDDACRNWRLRLPPLNRFDMVVSDNLPEILHHRPDAVLSGSFLWHLALEGIDPRIAEDAERLLTAHRPPMVSSILLGMPSLAARTRLLPVGLYVCEPRPYSSGRDLLIAGGGTSVMDDELRALVSSIAAGERPMFPVIWVDPRLLPERHPDWMKPAVFESGLYRRLAAAICRPGVGTVTDCLWAGARVFAVMERGNAEIVWNARRLAEAGVGEAAADPLAAYRAACAFAADEGRRAAQKAATDRLDFNGAAATVAILAKLRSGQACVA